MTRPSSLTTAYLPQDRTEAPDGSALDEALRGAGTIVDLAKPSIGDIKRIDLIYEGDAAMWTKTAYALKARAKIM